MIRMPDKKQNRFSEKEKHVLYSLFKKYQGIIDIKQRKSSYSSHKQSEVRGCWELILTTFNEHPHSNERTMKQIQKFWLNSKLRNRLPSTTTANGELKNTSSNQSIDSKQDMEDGYNETFAEDDEINNISGDDNIEVKFISAHKRVELPPSNITNEADPFSNIIYKTNNTTTECVLEICENSRNKNDVSLPESVEPQSQYCQSETNYEPSSSYNEKMSILKIQEMENRVKESQLRCELQQIYLLKAKEELAQMRDIHEIKMEELRTTLDCLKKSSQTDKRLVM